jgi:hypothetical protein
MAGRTLCQMTTREARANFCLVPFAREYRKFPVFSQLAGNLAWFDVSIPFL